MSQIDGLTKQTTCTETSMYTGPTWFNELDRWIN